MIILLKLASYVVFNCPDFISVYENFTCTLSILAFNPIDINIDFGDGDVKTLKGLSTDSYNITKMYSKDNFYEIRANIIQSKLNFSSTILVYS